MEKFKKRATSALGTLELAGGTHVIAPDFEGDSSTTVEERMEAFLSMFLLYHSDRSRFQNRIIELEKEDELGKEPYNKCIGI